jgi:hypothetical protein
MSKKPFVPLEGLNRLTPEQLEEYYLAACAFLQVPPELGLLYYRFVDTGDAGAERMLLIKRGACEVIRGRMGISTKSLVRQPDAKDYISYQAIGTDSSGRQEIAIGSQTTHNQFAKDIANADMAASTKALIRLTLQFAGGGFLWEGEIDSKIATNTDTAKPVPAQEKIAATPVPQVAPVATPGKDITLSIVDPNPATVNSTIPKAEEAPVAEAPVKRKYTKRKKEEVPVAPVVESKVGDTVELSDGTKVAIAAIGASPAAPAAPVASIPQNVPQAQPAAPVEPTVPLLELPNAEELRAFRARNAEYSGIYFKKGNMQPLAGIGGNHQQLEAYWQKCIPNFTSGKQLTKNQWTSVLTKLDEIRENQGLEGLVKHVQDAIQTGG